MKIDPATAKRISAAVRRIEALPITTVGANKRYPASEMVVGYATESIDAATGDITSDDGVTPGSGEVKLCVFDGDVLKKIDDDNTLTAYNFTTKAIDPSVGLQLVSMYGVWVIIGAASGGIVRIILTSTLSGGTTATVSVDSGEDGGTITVHNRLALSGPSGAIGYATMIDGVWDLIQLSCS